VAALAAGGASRPQLVAHMLHRLQVGGMRLAGDALMPCGCSM
jgi:hypothetical protein